jgi:hypothetical protein
MKFRTLGRATAVGMSLALIVAGVASADVVSNNVDATVDTAYETMNIDVTVATTDDTTMVLWSGSATDTDPLTGCNLGGTNTHVTFGVKSDDTSVATVSPSTITFTGCAQSATTGTGDANQELVTVTGVGNGTAHIYLSTAAGDGFELVTNKAATASNFLVDFARFTVNVTGFVTNHAPGDPGAPTLNAGSTSPNNTGTFRVDWTASTDPDGDTVSYELQKRDANDADWTPVGSNITNNYRDFTNEPEGSWKYRVRASDNHGAMSAWAEDSLPIVKVDKSNPNAPSASATTPSVYTDGSSHNWWKDTVTVHFTSNGDPALIDSSAGSGVNASSITSDQTFTTLGLHTASGTVKDNATNESSAGTLDVYVDDSDPTFGGCPAGGPFFLNTGNQAVGPITANDTGSGVDAGASTLSGTIDTSSVGTKSVLFTAYDNVGHSATTSCDYSVSYVFTGFFDPVNNPGWTEKGTVFNKAVAGKTIPLKWRLTDGLGNPVLTLAYPNVKAVSLSCSLGSTADLLEEYASGNSGLQNLGNGYYQFNWATPKTYSNSCKTLELRVGDGSVHTADFQFIK